MLNITAIFRNQLSQIEFLRFHKFFAYFQLFISSHFLSHSPTLTFCLILSFSLFCFFLSLTKVLFLSILNFVFLGTFNLFSPISCSLWSPLCSFFISLRSQLTLFPLSFLSLCRCPTPSKAEIAFEFLESCHSF